MAKWIEQMTPAEFKQARHALGLSPKELGRILDVHPRTVRRWEDPGSPSSRPPGPTACQVLRWMLAGFNPSEYEE